MMETSAAEVTGPTNGVRRNAAWKRNLEHPIMVALETTNKCNATCWFCPITDGSTRPPADGEPLIRVGKQPSPEEATGEHGCSGSEVESHQMKRPLGVMSDDLFEKIIDDCKQFPLRTLEPYLHGEPFMDPNILPRIEYINRHLPNTRVRMFTNGSMLTKKAVAGLKDLNIFSLVVSLNTAVPEKYNAIMGLNFDKTMDKLRHLAHENRNDAISKRFTIRMTAPEETTREEIKRFKKLARSLGARPVVVSLHNYKGDINTERPVPRYPCYFVRDLDILYDGKTSLCCMDHDGDHGWGDVSKRSVLEVFNSDEGLRYRELMREDRRDELYPCNECNMFWWDFGKTGMNRAKFTGRVISYMVKHRPFRF